MTRSAEPGQLGIPLSAQGRWVSLRPVARPDYLTLFKWRADMEFLHLWTPERRIPTFDEYVDELERLLPSTITLLIVPMGQEPIGFVQAYHLSHVNGWCCFLMYVVPEHRSKGYPLEALFLFGKYAFSNFNFRKVYADVFSYNDSVLGMLKAAGFQEEGRLKEHIFFDGQFWDLCHLSLYRRDWESLKERLSASLYRTDDGAG